MQSAALDLYETIIGLSIGIFILHKKKINSQKKNS